MRQQIKCEIRRSVICLNFNNEKVIPLTSISTLELKRLLERAKREFVQIPEETIQLIKQEIKQKQQ